MDEHNVHHFWGISPALDLGSLLPSDVDGAAALPVDQPIRMLQVAPYDARHTLATICRATRHPLIQQQRQPVQLVVWEDSPEGLARHVLLLAVLLDGSLLPRERAELLLELHGNALLRERAAAYLDEKARQLEALVVELAGGGARGGAGAGGGGSSSSSATALDAEAREARGLTTLGQILDLSLLKFQEKDQLVEALQRWRTTVPYDMVKAWDARARKWYGDRYDFRRNLVDWDYHMRLQPAGTPGQDPALGSIIHFHHFRHWRMHGVAHELRDSHYGQPNRSVLSTAYGRTREFKDRQLRDVGRSVSAWGFWADTLNGPYHCFGSLTDEPSFYRVANKQFARTAVDIAEHNVAALLHELRIGSPLVLAAGSEAPRAKVARGPTSIEDLTQQGQGQGQEPAGEGRTEGQQQQQQQAGKGEGEGEEGKQDSSSAVTGAPEQIQSCPGSEPAATTTSTTTTTATTATTTATTDSPGQGVSQGGSPGAEAAPPPADTSTPSAPPPKYTSGGRAAVTQAVAAAAAAASGAGAEGAVARPAVEAETGTAEGSAAPGGAEEEARRKMAAEEEALRAAEAALDAEARSRVAERFRLQLVTGDLAKGVTGRAKFSGAFSVLTLGHRHVHMLGPEYGLLRAAAPGAVMVAENARHVLQLTREQAGLFVTKMDEMAAGAGWRRAAARPPGVTEASEVYSKPRDPA